MRRTEGDGVRLIIGNIYATVDEFRELISTSAPVGLVAIDVDTYSSSKSALRLFDGSAEQYLPMTFVYFDDSGSRSHFTRFAGELLSIDEFNDEHEFRKLDIDRGVWNAHRQIGPQLWYERMQILHVFDHPWRTARRRTSDKVLRG